jgi:hypothetical protein
MSVTAGADEQVSAGTAALVQFRGTTSFACTPSQLEKDAAAVPRAMAATEGREP